MGWKAPDDGNERRNESTENYGSVRLIFRWSRFTVFTILALPPIPTQIAPPQTSLKLLESNTRKSVISHPKPDYTKVIANETSNLCCELENNFFFFLQQIIILFYNSLYNFIVKCENEVL